jgi:hypothetical protein
MASADAQTCALISIIYRPTPLPPNIRS